jgi:hypothetical protein
MGDWREVVAEQLAELERSGLRDAMSHLLVGVVGDQPLDMGLSPKSRIIFHEPDLKLGEIPTLQALHNHSQLEDFTVLYMHTKGVSSQERGYDRDAMDAWRRYMEHFCVGRWRECVASLDGCDAVGCECKASSVPKFFRGNFWWSRSPYLRALCPVAEIVLPPRLDGREREHRRKAEFWLGSNPSFKPRSMFDLGGEWSQPGYLYKHPVPPELYAGQGRG